MRRWRFVITVLAFVLTAGAAFALEASRVAVAEFSRLTPGGVLPASWQMLTASRIERHTHYAVQTMEGVTAVRADADASMSSLATKINIDPTVTPWLHWRWRIAGTNPASAFEGKQHDDFVARVYVFFDYDLERLPFFQRTKIRLARAIYGKELPLAALCYVWADKEPVGASAWNAYTDRVRMIAASSGNEKAQRWVDVERNVVDDYRAAFGEPVPRITGIAIATDSDDTRSHSTAWYGDAYFASSPSASPP